MISFPGTDKIKTQFIFLILKKKKNIKTLSASHLFFVILYNCETVFLG